MREEKSSAQKVIDLILGRIREGVYVPGQQLIVRELCRELGLSKAPVREAIHVLVGDDVVELSHNRSARIRLLSSQDILDFVEVWTAVGGTNARLAASRLARAADRRLLERKLRDVLDAAREGGSYKYFMAIAEFHRALAALSGNKYIKAFLAHIHFEHYHRHVSQYVPGRHWDQHVSRFREFCETILKGDGKRAQTQFEAHMATVTEYLRSELRTPSAADRNDPAPAKTLAASRVTSTASRTRA